MLWLLVPLAAAADLTVHPDPVIEPVEGSFYERGLGRPGVDWDGVEYALYFETVLPDSWAEADYPGCDQVGVIGRATSPDGLTWVVDADPVLTPDDVSWVGCSVGDPTVTWSGSDWDLWFVGDGTALGRASSRRGARFTAGSTATLEFTSLTGWSGLGHPTASWLDAARTEGFVLLAGIHPEGEPGFAYAATQDGGRSWTTGTSMSPSARVPLAVPSLVCGGGIYSYRAWTLYFRGSDWSGEGEAIKMAGGKDEHTWYVPAPYYVGVLGWTGQSSLRTSTDHLLVWATVSGSIQLAYTDPAWDPADTEHRLCGAQDADPDPDPDTGNDPDTDVDSDTDVDPDTDTDGHVLEPQPALVLSRDGCGCGGSHPSGWWLLGLVPLVGRRRKAR